MTKNSATDAKREREGESEISERERERESERERDRRSERSNYWHTRTYRVCLTVVKNIIFLF